MATKRYRDGDNAKVLSYIVTIALLHCRHRILAIALSLCRIIVLASSRYRITVIALSVSHYRIIVIALLCGASVAEWLRSLTLYHLPLTTAGSNLDSDFELFHVKKLSS
jgi:hypothetical protein